MRYYLLTMEAGETLDDDGQPVHWAACPALPGAYEEGPSAGSARERLVALARRIVAEHLMRDDPLDPEITVADHPVAARDDLLVVGVSDADVEQARRAPRLLVEQPEP